MNKPNWWWEGSIMAALLAFSLLLIACGQKGDGLTPTPTSVATLAPSPSPTTTATATPSATPEPPVGQPAPVDGKEAKANGATGGSGAERPLIGIDAGHGGSAVGAVHRDAQGRVDLVEKDLTLAVALRVRELLQAGGFGVILDRERDAAVNVRGADLNNDGKVDNADEIQARLDLFNAAGVDVLLSIHFNGFPSPAMRGTATYYCPDRPFASQSRRLAGLVQEAMVGRLRAMGAQVVDKGVQDDALLGKPYGHLMTLGPATPRIVRPGKMPGVLVEPLFLTNEYEAGLLKEEATLEAIAQGLAQAVETYIIPEPAPVTPTPTRPRQTEASGEEIPREIVRGPAVPMVALTFDLGGGAQHTPAILEALARYGVNSTFFITGQWVEANPSLARRIVAAGHEPANHSYSHPNLTQLPDDRVKEELSRMEEALQDATGRSSKPWFRPPFGARDGRLLALVAGLGYRSVYWTLDSGDWREEATPQEVLERVLSGASNGAIIVLHGNSPQTAQVLPQMIEGLRARGFRLVTVSGLLDELP